MREFVQGFYTAQIMGGILEQSMRKVLHEVFPDKVDKPAATLDPEQVIREIIPIPEEKLNDVYTALAEFAPKDKQIEYWRKSFELDKKYMGDSVGLAESYYFYAETLLENELLDEAVKVLQEGIEKFEGDTLIRDLLLQALIKKKDFKNAIKQLDLLLTDDSSFLGNYIEVEEVYAPLRALPEFKVVEKKYQST